MAALWMLFDVFWSFGVPLVSLATVVAFVSPLSCCLVVAFMELTFGWVVLLVWVRQRARLVRRADCDSVFLVALWYRSVFTESQVLRFSL
eukprot:scaffold31497_cov80-Skeletonema_dohrnii-CCMP3373.AAC.1